VEALGDVYDYVTSSTRTSDSPDLRVPQINGCAYCVDMHTRALINKGVSADKLVLVPLWREASSLFDKRVAMTAVFAQSESNSIRCWTNEIVNERYRFANTGNNAMRIVGAWSSGCLAPSSSGSEVTSTTGKALFRLRFRKLPMAPGMRCRTGFPTLQHFQQRDK